MKKVLLAYPTSSAKDYCVKEFVKQLDSITYPVDILVIDNSKEPKHALELDVLMSSSINKRVSVIHYYQDIPIRELICKCHNIIREFFLDSDYDYLFSLESDVFCSKNTIEHLMSFNKLVIGLPYFIKQSYYSEYIGSVKETFGYIQYELNRTADEGFLFTTGTIKQVNQSGIGCHLIHRSVLEQVRFRVGSGNIDNFDDQYFHEDLKSLNIPVYSDTANMAFHWNGNWNKIKMT